MRRTLGAGLAAAMEPVLDLVFPPRCPACGGGVGRHGGLCGACWAALAIPTQPWCARCQCDIQRQHPSVGHEQGEAICAACLAQPPRHAGIYAATFYTPVSRKLVLAFKHGRRIALAAMLARLMAARLPDDGGHWLLVPVPLHRWRLWSRGYNQSALLASELQKLGKGQLAIDLLERREATPSLGGLGAQARRQALAGAIGIRAGSAAKGQVEGRDILLVDDVMTSGATTDACVAVLMDAGARRVRIVCSARVREAGADLVHRPPSKTPGTL